MGKSLTKYSWQWLFLFLTALAVIFFMGDYAWSQETNTSLVNVNMEDVGEPGRISVVLEIFAVLTVLSLAPSILIMLTSFTRIAIVLSLLRQAVGTNQSPATQIIVGLSIFLTIFIMTPVWNEVNEEAFKPYRAGQLSATDAVEKASIPIRKFMLKHTREKDLGLMVSISGSERPQNVDSVPTMTIIPAFIISELKTAFQIGMLLYIPFLIIDMVIASILLSMGMMMLPPVMISLPFKLTLFVLADGWYLVIGSLVKSFGV